MERLATLDFVHKAQNLFITGSSGTEKLSGLCPWPRSMQKGIPNLLCQCPKLLGALKVAKVKGTPETELKKIERCQLLILDDLFIPYLLMSGNVPYCLKLLRTGMTGKSVMITS